MTPEEQRTEDQKNATAFENWLTSPNARRGIAHLARIFQCDGAMFRADDHYNTNAALIRDGQRQVVLMLRAAKAEVPTTPTENENGQTA